MSETEKADIVERLRADVFYGDERLARLRDHNPLHLEAAAEIERLRALPSRNDVLEEAARVARETGAHFLTNRDAYVLHGPAAIVAGIVQAIRALKKDTDNG